MGDRVLGFGDIGNHSGLLGDDIYVGYGDSGGVSSSDNNNDQDHGAAEPQPKAETLKLRIRYVSHEGTKPRSFIIFISVSPVSPCEKMIRLGLATYRNMCRESF